MKTWFLGIYYYLRGVLKIRQTKIYFLESHIFGHLVLEYAEVLSQLNKTPMRILVCFIKPVCNGRLEKILKQNLRKNSCYLANNYDALRFALRIDQALELRFHKKRKFIKAADFDLSHQRASELSEMIELPLIDSRKASALLERDTLSVAILNRSAEYKKYREESSIYLFRNFDFQSFNRTIEENDEVHFFRLGQYQKDLDSIQKLSKYRNLTQFSENLELDEQTDLALMRNLDGYFGADTGPLWFFLLRSVPVAVVNEIPLMQRATTLPHKFIVIPKLIWDTKEKKLLTLSQMTSPFVANLRFTNDYVSNGLEVVDNSEDQIAEFFSEWRSLSFHSTSVYDNERMDWIRSKTKCSNLPSISETFLRSYAKQLEI